MKKRGSLTIEATLLIVIILSVMGGLITIGVIFQKNMQLYAEVDQSAETVALYFYGSQRLASGITNNGEVFSSGDISAFGNVLLGYGHSAAAATSVYAYESMLKYDLCHKYGGDVNFNQNFWLSDIPKIKASMGQNCIIIDVEKTFKARQLIPIVPDITFNDRHIVPIKSAVSIISGYGNPTKAKIYVTQNGKNDSGVYHVYTDCFAGRSAKGFEAYPVTKSEIGSNVMVESGAFRICSFCRKRLESGK